MSTLKMESDTGTADSRWKNIYVFRGIGSKKDNLE
jgi:hypothetical protein